MFLLEGDESGRMRCTNTGTTMSDGFVGDRKLSQVVACHLRLDFNAVEDLAVVDPNHAANHLGDNDHVPQMSLDGRGLLVRWGLLFRFPELLDETHGLPLKATLKTSSSTSVDELHKVFIRHIKELLEFNTTVGE